MNTEQFFVSLLMVIGLTTATIGIGIWLLGLAGGLMASGVVLLVGASAYKSMAEGRAKPAQQQG